MSRKSSNSFARQSDLKKMATPLACEEKELKIHLPPHSFFTFFSIAAEIRVSHAITQSKFFFLRWWKTFLRFGFFPIELALKQIILKLDADSTPPELRSGLLTQFFDDRSFALKWIENE